MTLTPGWFRRFLRFWPWLVLVALVLSLTTNILLLIQARNYYAQGESVRLDPLNLDAFSNPLIRAPSVRHPLVLFYGDSRAAHWPAPPGQERFQFQQRGIDGQTSAKVLGRFDAHVSPLKPDNLVLEVGINDLKTIPVLQERRGVTIKNLVSNIQEIIYRAQAQGSTVILATILPVGDVSLTGRVAWRPYVAPAIHETNRELIKLTAPGVFILDSEAILAPGGQTRTEYYQDTIHLNDRGYQALNAVLGPLLEGISVPAH